MQLTARDLVKVYSRRKVVAGISLEVNQSEIVGLLGPNGAGKTTTFYMMVGLIRPNRGTVLLGERDLTGIPMYLRARMGIGYLPQEPSVFRKLSVADNIMAILQMQEMDRSQRQDKLEFLLQEFNIDHLRDQAGYLLSGGERRRVEIARTMATDPSFILLDEPFTGVDPIAVGDIQDIIADLKEKGIGILVTDHSVRETLAITDRSYIIFEGKILTSGPSSELPNDPIAKKFYLGDRFQM